MAFSTFRPALLILFREIDDIRRVGSTPFGEDAEEAPRSSSTARSKS